MNDTPPTEEDPGLVAGLGVSELILVAGIFLVLVGVGASCDPLLLQKMMRSPKALKAAAIGVMCQFVIMPLLAFGLTVVFRVSNDYTAFGFLLVGCMPGGNTSNVFCVWSQGILELSVFMTLSSMLCAFGLTPLCLWAYSRALGLDASVVAVPQIGMAFALLLVPLTLGVALNCLPWFQVPLHKQKFEKMLGIFAFFMFALILVLLVYDYAGALEGATWRSHVPAVLIFPLSVTIAYWITALLKLEPALRRTILLEVGFQNVAMGFAIGQATIPTQALREDAVPFPLIYGITQFGWAGLLVPLCRYQKYYNETHGIVDMDPHFFSTEDENEKENNGIELEETFDDSVNCDTVPNVATEDNDNSNDGDGAKTEHEHQP